MTFSLKSIAEKKMAISGITVTFLVVVVLLVAIVCETCRVWDLCLIPSPRNLEA